MGQLRGGTAGAAQDVYQDGPCTAHGSGNVTCGGCSCDAAKNAVLTSPLAAGPPSHDRFRASKEPNHRGEVDVNGHDAIDQFCDFRRCGTRCALAAVVSYMVCD